MPSRCTYCRRPAVVDDAPADPGKPLCFDHWAVVMARYHTPPDVPSSSPPWYWLAVVAIAASLSSLYFASVLARRFGP